MRKGTWRTVAGEPVLKSGRGGLLGPATTRRARWWEMHLECGHDAERTVRYRPQGDDGWPVQRGGTQHRSRDDILPAPRRVLCSTGACRR
jgi:hypothetical protein